MYIHPVIFSRKKAMIDYACKSSVSIVRLIVDYHLK